MSDVDNDFFVAYIAMLVFYHTLLYLQKDVLQNMFVLSIKKKMCRIFLVYANLYF